MADFIVYLTGKQNIINQLAYTKIEDLFNILYFFSLTLIELNFTASIALYHIINRPQRVFMMWATIKIEFD